MNRPELQAARFVPDPFRAGERLYRTGDLARRAADGELEYLGRIDQEVNIRSFRIKLWEIESALIEHPAVHEAVVVIRSNAGDNRLSAFVVLASGGSDTDADKLSTYLRPKLPAHMLPQSIGILPAFPLSRDGKIDCDALISLRT